MTSGKVVHGVLTGAAIGVAVAILGASGLVGMSIYVAWIDGQAGINADERMCECCS